MIRSVCLAAAAALLLLAPSSASAFWPYYGGFGHAWGHGYAYTANYGGYIPAPPYYSVFPPVYYSAHITKRHYGASPYAWPAGMQPIMFVNRTSVASSYATRSDLAAAPQMIENSYIKAARPASATTADLQLEVQPLRIDNPYLAKAGR